ncbi:hypothetical protein [Paenibacillus sp. FSL R7-0272]|uniref:hypothetical protein n=1 Tax=Paenibacillus sp. FSL R7-0272 TaxID=2921679 RepID=UPI0030EC5901
MATLWQRLPEPEDGWRRYDNLYSAITYTGTWQTETLAANYNGSARYTQVSNSTVNFSFQGTKLRVMGGQWTGRTTTAQVNIDGANRGVINENANSGTTQSLVFDISGLSDGVHTVQIKTVDTSIFLFDSIDIDADGYLLWGVSTSPEEGWSRYDIVTTLPNVVFTGVWNTNNNFTVGWGNTLTSTSTFGRMAFWFYGTKLRIYDSPNINRSTRNMISIDGINKEYTAYRTSVLDQVIVFEITGLSLGYHYVEISIPSTETGKILAIDSIEIDSTGEFRKPYSKMLLSSGNEHYSLGGMEYVNVTPQMTSNFSASPIVPIFSTEWTNGIQSGAGSAFNAFDGDKGRVFGWASSSSGYYIGIDWSTPKKIIGYRLSSHATIDNTPPTAWFFESSNDNLSWTILDTKSGVNWTKGETKEFLINNVSSFRYYRIRGTLNLTWAIAEFEMLELSDPYLINLPNLAERTFMNYGKESIVPVSVMKKIKKVEDKYIKSGTSTTFEHSINMSKRRVDKIMLG